MRNRDVPISRACGKMRIVVTDRFPLLGLAGSRWRS
jgi:hypothetical protein